jgi:hypothetical protein
MQQVSGHKLLALLTYLHSEGGKIKEMIEFLERKTTVG